MVGDVLDLVRAGAAVGLLELRQNVGERLSGEVHAEQPRRDLILELRRQRRNEALGLEGWVADRFGAKGIEARCEVAVRPVGLDERHRGSDGAEERLVGDRCRRRLGLARDGRRSLDHRSGLAVLGGAQELDEPRNAGMLREQVAIAALEQRAPLGGHALWVLEVFVEKRARITSVESVDLSHDALFFVAGAFPLSEGATRAAWT